MPANDPAVDITLLVLDVDGVLTDGSIHISDHGVETKRFHVRDGTGLSIWRKLGGQVAIITGRTGMAVRHRANELGIALVFDGVQDKRQAFGAALSMLGLVASQAAVVGDDLPDLSMMRLAGYPIAVADAALEIVNAAAFVTIKPGGHGAVREAIEHVLRAQNRWDEALALF